MPAVTAPMAKTPIGVRPTTNFVIRTMESLRIRSGSSTRARFLSPMMPIPSAELNRTTAGMTAFDRALNGLEVKYRSGTENEPVGSTSALLKNEAVS